MRLLKRRPRLGHLTLGVASLLFGVVLVPLPVPLGWLFLLVGMALVAHEVLWIQRVIAWFRRTLPWADRILMTFYGVSPPFVQAFLDSTSPAAVGESGEARSRTPGGES